MEESFKSANQQLGTEVNFNIKRAIMQHQEAGGYKPTSEFFSALSPDVLFQFLCLVCNKYLEKYSVSDTTFKVNIFEFC